MLHEEEVSMKKRYLVLLAVILLSGCNTKHKVEDINKASMEDMAIHVQDNVFQLQQPLSSVLDHGWQITSDKKDDNEELYEITLKDDENHTISLCTEIVENKKIEDTVIKKIQLSYDQSNDVSFDLPAQINNSSTAEDIFEAYGLPNIYVRNHDGSYELKYVQNLEYDMKHIIDIQIKNEKLSTVVLSSEWNMYDSIETSSFELEKALGYKPFINLIDIQNGTSDDIKNMQFQLGDVVVPADPTVNDFLNTNWKISTIYNESKDLSNLQLEKDNKPINIMFDGKYTNVSDIDKEAKIYAISLRSSGIPEDEMSTDLLTINGKNNVNLDDVIQAYGTPNEVYYDATRIIVAYHFPEDDQKKIIFKATPSHEIFEVMILYQPQNVLYVYGWKEVTLNND